MRFNLINNRCGHDVGDETPKHIVNVLAQDCRGPDLVGCYSGEEVLVLFEVATAEESFKMAERLRQLNSKNILSFKKDAALWITVSIRIGVIMPSGEGIDDLLRRTSKVFYAAKAKGRNRVD